MAVNPTYGSNAMHRINIFFWVKYELKFRIQEVLVAPAPSVKRFLTRLWQIRPFCDFILCSFFAAYVNRYVYKCGDVLSNRHKHSRHYLMLVDSIRAVSCL